MAWFSFDCVNSLARVSESRVPADLVEISDDREITSPFLAKDKNAH